MESLVKEHELFSNILNKSFDSIACYTPIRDHNNTIIDFKFIYLNDSAFKTLSGTREDFIGKSLLNLFPAAAEDGMFDAFRKTAETGEPIEDTFYYEQGVYKGWYRDSIVKYGDGIIVFFRDVSDRKAMELELVKQNLTMEKLLIEKDKLISEKEILLRETHHRVKNNLQIISSLLNMQSASIHDPDFLENCGTCKRRIATMAMIHHRLYEDKDFRSINMSRFVNEIVKYHKDLFEGNSEEIKFIIKVEELFIDLNLSVNIGLIVNELLTNSIKHAFKGRRGGEINITMVPNNNDIFLAVSDNGIGLPQIFRGTNVNTLGLSLVHSLVEQMEGSLKINCASGTKFFIVLPEILVFNEA